MTFTAPTYDIWKTSDKTYQLFDQEFQRHVLKENFLLMSSFFQTLEMINMEFPKKNDLRRLTNEWNLV